MSRATSDRTKTGVSGETASSMLNVVIYQVGWFACVLGAAGGWPQLGAALALALVGVHLLLASQPRREWPVLCFAVALGLIVDSAHASFGVLDFQAHTAGRPAPLWVLALWVQFGSALHFSLRWLSRRYVLASVLGLVGGPMAFLGGERLGAAVFGEPRALTLAVVGLSWALAMPLLVWVADRWSSEGLYRLPRTAAGTGRLLLGSRGAEVGSETAGR